MKTTVLFVVAVLVSALVYMPGGLQRAVFGRVVVGPFRSEFTESFWSTHYPEKCMVPYFDYKPLIADHGLPAPPLYGFIWALTSYLSCTMSCSHRDLFTTIVYIVQVVLVLLFITLTARFIVNTETPTIALITLIFCAMYSLETLSILLVVLAVRCALRGDFTRSLFCAGLAFSISYFNITVLVLLVFYALREKCFNYKCIVGFLLGLSPYITLLVVKPEYYNWLLTSILRPYMPLSIYRLISSFLGEEFSYRISVSVWLTLLVVTCGLTPRSLEKLGRHVYSVLLVLYTLHPYSYPQTLLLVLFTGLIAQTLKPERYYFILEVVNAATMILYLRSTSPLSIEDPAQLAAQVRNAILLADTAITLTTIYKESET